MRDRDEVRNELFMELMGYDKAFRTITADSCPQQKAVQEALRIMVKHMQQLQLQLAVVNGDMK